MGLVHDAARGDGADGEEDVVDLVRVRVRVRVRVGVRARARVRVRVRVRARVRRRCSRPTRPSPC